MVSTTAYRESFSWLFIRIEGTADRNVDGSAMVVQQSKNGKSEETQEGSDALQKALPQKEVMDDKRLKDLAQSRAEGVKTYLTRAGKVAAKRIEPRPVKIKAAPGGDQGHVELFLSAQ